VNAEGPEPAAPDQRIREALDDHGRSSAAGDADAEHDIDAGDAVFDDLRPGERILGRRNF